VLGEQDLLDELLGEAQARHLLGPGDPAAHRQHAEAFGRVLQERGRLPARIVDLGSGAGLPGLPLAALSPESELVLVDRRTARTDWLRRAVGRLGWTDRVRVLAGEADELGRGVWREWADVVVARAFGAPAVTAELARAFVRDGGVAVVSEPPGAREEGRWPERGLRALGWGPVEHVGSEPAFVVLTASGPCPAAVPRRANHIQRRPAF